MKRTSFSEFKCPAAQALDKVGDWWTMLLIRDAFQGLSRFDEFEKSLGIAPNMLARRLRHLTDAGLFEKHRYSDRPARFEYRLTEWGREFFPVLVTLFQWGNRQNEADKVSMLLGAVDTGAERRPAVIDEVTGETITLENTMLLAGPSADADVLDRVARVRAARLAHTLS
jgi:DNA-binding HxlR family transcriptional regulator